MAPETVQPFMPQYQGALYSPRICRLMAFWNAGVVDVEFVHDAKDGALSLVAHRQYKLTQTKEIEVQPLDQRFEAHVSVQ